MTSASGLAGLLRVDAMRIRRDRFLLGATLYILIMSAAMRWILPWGDRVMRSRWDLVLEPYFPLLSSYFAVVMGTLAVGIVGGFLLLEIREDRTILALSVSPLPLERYVMVTSVVLALVAAALIGGEASLIGHGRPGTAALSASAVVAGLGAPVVALFVATLAQDKVQAFALLKVVGLAGAVPLGAYFLPEPWQYLACVVPVFWPVKAWWVAESGGAAWPLWLLGGAAWSVLPLVLLIRRFVGAGRTSGG